MSANGRIRHLGEPLGGTEGLLEVVSLKKATESVRWRGITDGRRERYSVSVVVVECLYDTVVLKLKSIFGHRIVKIGTVEDFASVRKFKRFIEPVDLSRYENV